ncbi:insulinase family protein [Ilyomonas limi]|uniref:Insulinase family protein n=1 Tax=Ilyomonas limi TaxID=2575867 RepID=A0A4U3L8M1_9BACT|nr:pitrilysin family protein [Ilyomonas limi]TKK71651.1 insulinase family protein [Ilyomonas limi]
MFNRILLTACICLYFFSTFAQPKVPEHVFYQKLENGLEVLVLEDHTIPFTTIEIACKNGSFTETPDFNGLSHLYEHLFFKSNKDYKTQDDYLKEISDLNIEFNGRTREEVVTYYFTLPKANTEKGMQFMNAAIRYPVFKKKDMQKENSTVDAEFQRQESSPYYMLIDTLDHMLWGSNYSRKNMIGNHNIILTATPEKMETIQNRYYYPNNCLLVVAGDVEHTEIFTEAKGIFGSWKPSERDPFTKWPIPEVTPLQQNKFVVIESELAQMPLLLFRWQGPDTRHDLQATYTADVFSYILNQRLSKLTAALEDKGLATNIGVNYYSQKYTGPITLSLTPNPHKIKECYEAIQKEIAQWDDDSYITDQQIERAKKILYITQVEEREEVQSYADLLCFWWASASIEYYTFYRENLNKVSRQDIKDYVRKYIKGKPFCAGLIVPQGADMNAANNFYSSK